MRILVPAALLLNGSSVLALANASAPTPSPHAQPLPVVPFTDFSNLISGIDWSIIFLALMSIATSLGMFYLVIKFAKITIQILKGG